MRSLLVCFLLIGLGSSSSIFAQKASAPTQTLSSTAEEIKRPAGAPSYADVCFSSRIRHPVNEKDRHDTFRDAAAFHATRLDWVISFDAEWIAQAKARGYSFGGWLSSILPDAIDAKPNTYLKGRIKNEKGELLTAPWMKSFKVSWGCVNSPQYRKTFLEHAKRLVDAKVDVIQIDDPEMNMHAVLWGACFCEFCKEKAKKQGVVLNDRLAMEDFQTESVRTFFKEMRAEVDAYAGRHVPMSSNNGLAHWWEFPYDVFEFGMGELKPDEFEPKKMLGRQMDTNRRGKSQVYTFVSEDEQMLRRLIAMTYALGANPIVPYDVYLRSTAKGAERYFGRPDQYADLFGFVRASSAWMNGYEDAAIAGPGFEDARWGKAPAVVWADNKRPLWAFARAVPKKQSAPAVIHLVDCGDKPGPSVLKLRTAAFTGMRAVKVKFFVPPPYDAAEHEKCEKNKDFSSLTATIEVRATVDGEWTNVELPALLPWGMLVVEPAP